MRTQGNNGNGSRPPQEIQAEIDRTRTEMDGTLSAIEQRLSPGQIIDQGMSYLRRNGGTEFVGNLGEQAKQNPLPVALVGIGIAWLMATGKNSGTAESGMAGSGTSQFGDAKQKMGDAKQKIGETADALRDRATQMRDTTRDQISRARDGLDTMMREQPLALGALGLALGALAGALTPRTDVEDKIAGPVRDRMAEKATDELKGAADELKSWQPQPSPQAKPAATVRPYVDPAVDVPPGFRGG